MRLEKSDSMVRTLAALSQLLIYDFRPRLPAAPDIPSCDMYATGHGATTLRHRVASGLCDYPTRASWRYRSWSLVERSGRVAAVRVCDDLLGSQLRSTHASPLTMACRYHHTCMSSYSQFIANTLDTPQHQGLPIPPPLPTVMRP